MADPETGTDSAAAAATPPQGTDAPQNDQTSAAAPPAPSFDEAFLKTLDGVDPASLPQPYREKLEKPFKSDYTRKTQELAEERRKFDIERQTTFDAVRKIIEARGTSPQGPTPEEERQKELLELASAGDGKAMQELIRMEATRQVQPLQTQMALKNAAETAIRTNPYVGSNWSEILGLIQNDPGLNALAKYDNYKYADKVMIALGLEREAMDLRGKQKASAQEIESLKAKISVLEKERTASLPSTTSKAGTTSGAPAPARPTEFMDIAKAAYLAQGGREEDWR